VNRVHERGGDHHADRFKLSQNPPAAGIDGVINGLRESGDLTGAAAVEQHRPQAEAVH
jgi:predicted FMN-binding regulatory protein PaiB